MALRFKCTASVIVIVFAIINVTDGMGSFFGRMTSNEDTHSYERIESSTGRFERLKWSTETLESLKISGTDLTAAAISKQIRCNDAYYMLSFLKLTNPKYFSYPDQMESLHVEINTMYPEWARKMLATAFNVAQKDPEMEVPWLFYLHVKRIELHAANDPDEEFLPVMQAAHNLMYEVLSSMVSEDDCTPLNPATLGEFPDYLADIQQPGPSDFSGNSDAVLELLSKHWPDLCLYTSLSCLREHDGYTGPVPGVQPLRENHLTLDMLYLNDVFENEEAATTLLMGFGVFKNGDELINYLKDKITEIKSGRTPFRQYVLSLVDFHEHVQRAFHTMMLRIYFVFMENLKKIDTDYRERYTDQFFGPFSDWCALLHFPKHDPFYVKLLPQSKEYDMYFGNETIHKLQEMSINNLTVIDSVAKVSMDNHTLQSLLNIEIEVSWLMNTARVHQISLNFRHKIWQRDPVGKIILCAEVLVGYMRKLFEGIHFRAIRSLIDLGRSTHLDRLVIK